MTTLVHRDPHDVGGSLVNDTLTVQEPPPVATVTDRYPMFADRATSTATPFGLSTRDALQLMDTQRLWSLREHNTSMVL
jgi:hypothetical protein